jgi:hypothetical protein
MQTFRAGTANEYDDFSPPVPIDLMLRRIDLLGDCELPQSP